MLVVLNYSFFDDFHLSFVATIERNPQNLIEFDLSDHVFHCLIIFYNSLGSPL